MNQSKEKPVNHRLRLAYLDGLRGLAALYVVLCHVWLLQWEQLPIANKFVRYGVFSVVVFIVLSGYCLMLPVARSKTGHIPGGLLDYFQRRGRRILPPYYAALILCLLLAVLIFAVQKATNFHWSDVGTANLFSPNFSFRDVLSHLLLIHNLNSAPQINLSSASPVYRINGPMWTVATEWQIYFLFPALLLPIWRRLGLLLVVIIAFLIGITPHYLLHGFIEAAHPWFLGLFGFGMAAAEIGFSQKPALILIRKSLPWGVLATTLTIAAFLSESPRFGLDRWINESFAGIAAACLLIYCTNFLIEGKVHPIVLRLLEAPWVIGLGSFSYSLYLVHAPVLVLVYHLLLSLQIPTIAIAAILLMVAVPISILIAYLFHLVFERPIMVQRLTLKKYEN